MNFVYFTILIPCCRSWDKTKKTTHVQWVVRSGRYDLNYPPGVVGGICSRGVVLRFHSALSAINGSTFDARRAGM